MGRRGMLLGGAAVLAGAALRGGAFAQGNFAQGNVAQGSVAQGSVAQGNAALDELEGRLEAGNAERFARFVMDHEGRMVSLRVTAAPVQGRDFSVAVEAPLLLINAPRPERVQVSLTGGYETRGAALSMENVYRVKAEGMQQGILIYVLDPVPPGEVRRLREAGVRKVAL